MPVSHHRDFDSGPNIETESRIFGESVEPLIVSVR